MGCGSVNQEHIYFVDVCTISLFPLCIREK